MPKKVGVNEQDLVKDAEYHHISFHLWKMRWPLCRLSVILKWKTIKFSRNLAKKIPTRPGVYAFQIQPRVGKIKSSYLIYIGKADKSIRDRYLSYHLEKKRDNGRPLIKRYLNQYEGHIYFSFAELAPPTRPGNIEKSLLEALIPPASPQLPSSVRRTIGAFPR